MARSEEDFDPGAKYHIPGNTPYTRYFLSFILQFQFHKALCDASGLQGSAQRVLDLRQHRGRQEVRRHAGAGRVSQPWQDTLQKLTGTREMDASAIIDYFKPLEAWLEEQNKGQDCGWD